MLPENTCEIPWPQFALRAATYDGTTKTVCVASGFAGLMAGLISFAILPLAVAPVAATLTLGVMAVVAALVCGKVATKPAYVLRKDSEGRPYVDRQEWWRREELTWPAG